MVGRASSGTHLRDPSPETSTSEARARARGSTLSSVTRGRRLSLGARPVPATKRRERTMFAAKAAHKANQEIPPSSLTSLACDGCGGSS
jgi:hypothetical protein